MEDSLIVAVCAAVLIAIVGAYAWSVAWVVRDSRKRGRAEEAILIAVLFGPFGALIWLVIRPVRTIADKPVSEFQSADDAFLAASQLDANGDWKAAIAVYRYSAERWPENCDYATRSIEQIRQKQV